MRVRLVIPSWVYKSQHRRNFPVTQEANYDITILENMTKEQLHDLRNQCKYGLDYCLEHLNWKGVPDNSLDFFFSFLGLLCLPLISLSENLEKLMGFHFTIIIPVKHW